jgi:hypothetical protein
MGGGQTVLDVEDLCVLFVPGDPGADGQPIFIEDHDRFVYWPKEDPASTVPAPSGTGLRWRVWISADDMNVVLWFDAARARLVACDAYIRSVWWTINPHAALPQPEADGALYLTAPDDDALHDDVSLDLGVPVTYELPPDRAWIRFRFDDEVAAAHYCVGRHLLAGIRDGRITDLYFQHLRIVRSADLLSSAVLPELPHPAA